MRSVATGNLGSIKYTLFCFVFLIYLYLAFITHFYFHDHQFCLHSQETSVEQLAFDELNNSELQLSSIDNSGEIEGIELLGELDTNKECKYDTAFQVSNDTR